MTSEIGYNNTNVLCKRGRLTHTKKKRQIAKQTGGVLFAENILPWRSRGKRLTFGPTQWVVGRDTPHYHGDGDREDTRISMAMLAVARRANQ